MDIGKPKLGSTDLKARNQLNCFQIPPEKMGIFLKNLVCTYPKKV
jgi:hypothetical protein